MALGHVPAAARGGGQVHRDLAVVLQVLGQIDRGHPARTEFPLDPVATAKGDGEAVGRRGHRVPLSRAMSLRREVAWMPDPIGHSS